MPSYTSSTRLARVQYDPAADGSVIATSFFETTLTNDDDPDDVSVKPWESVTHTIPAELAAEVEEHATDALDTKRATIVAEKAAAKAEAALAAKKG